MRTTFSVALVLMLHCPGVAGAPPAADEARATPVSLEGAETREYRADVGADPLRIHIFKPDGWSALDRRPALLHFFGGGFVRGTPRNAAGWARTAARWGMIGLAPDYRTRERFGTDGTACVSDARAAMHWVQEHADELGIDPRRVVVSGSSAGGHLALWTAIRHSPPGSDPARAPLHPPAALVLFSAASDTSAALGQRADRFAGHGDACSPVHQLDAPMPPVLMFHGDADAVVPYIYARDLDRALRMRGIVPEFVTVPGGGHNLNDSPGWREKLPELVAGFFQREEVLPLAPGARRGVGMAAAEHHIAHADELAPLLPNLSPGDSVVLADGTWRDADLVFRGEGTAAAPITLRARTAGRVVFTGASRLRLAGRHLVVDGLVFDGCALRQGHAVVGFRDGDGRAATHSRLTNTAILDCNPPDRLTDYKWVSLYGTDNRVDHCRFAGKDHQGALLVVWLDGQPNRHRIDHNAFGPRPPHNRNGAETIRIGTSDWSQTRSDTLVDSNFFFRCDGEAEIISSKSWGNVFRGNTFVECQGALTLRHGNSCLVEGNWFLGRGRPNTGGVRIIGENHRVARNHFEALTGDRYYAALSMVLGIPGSPLNGYFQVRGATVMANTFAHCAHTFSLGIIEGRPEGVLPPVDGVIAGNQVVHPAGPILHAPAGTEGLRFADNRVAPGSDHGPLPDGFRGVAIEEMESLAGGRGPLTEAEVGPTWR